MAGYTDGIHQVGWVPDTSERPPSLFIEGGIDWNGKRNAIRELKGWIRQLLLIETFHY
jgi:hypothetical protein